ncbi:MAG: magnesium transporter [Candidatus Sumerlaeia bacterium]
MLGKLLEPDIHDMLERKNLRELRDALLEFPSPDVAELITEISEEDRAIVFRLLPRDMATDAFEHLSVDDQQELLESLNQEQCRRIIEEMDPDDRTGLLEELPTRVTRKLLRLLTPDERRIAQKLLGYPEDSVGRLMTPDYIDLREGMTAGEAIDFIRRVGLDKETVYACYVTRDNHVLVGTVGLRTLVLAPADAPVEDLMKSPPVAMVHTNTDQEEAAALLQNYDLLALPVVDNEDRLVGIVTVDDIMDVISEETEMDMQVMAGILPETESSYLKQRILSISWRRGLPLIGLVVGQALAGMVMREFHEQLSTIIALAFFIPMVMATGGGMGIQTSTLIVRGLGRGDIELRDFFKILGRELLICSLIGAVLGLAAFGLSYFMVSVGYGVTMQASGPFQLGLTVFLALLFVMVLSVVVGTILPIFFSMLKLDPAVMTSPFLTTIVDILGLMIYFYVASKIFSL